MILDCMVFTFLIACCCGVISVVAMNFKKFLFLSNLEVCILNFAALLVVDVSQQKAACLKLMIWMGRHSLEIFQTLLLAFLT